MVAVRFSVVIAFMMFSVGCAGSFAKPDSTQHYGRSPTGYETAVPEYFEMLLKDPDSAKYRYGQPFRAYRNTGLIYGGGVTWTGWAMVVNVNARNSFGGYTGYKTYTVLFNAEFVMGHFEGTKHVLFHAL